MKKVYRRSRADRWSSLFGQVAVYSFVVTAISGVFLLLYYKPSMTQVSYHGSYRKLDGVPMSQAYRSTLDISFDVRGGLLMRQIHHWAALLFIAAVCAHLLRLYFTGGFRRPRWLNWLIWVVSWCWAWSGMSGNISPTTCCPAGAWACSRGSRFDPGYRHAPDVVDLRRGLPRARDHRAGVLAARGGAAGGDDRAVRAAARRSRPVITPVSVVMFWFTCATLALLGTFAQVNPVWLFGPNQAGSISAGSVPGWYMGFLDGALRIMPGWEFSVFGHPLTLAVLVPGVLVPGAFFTLLAVYPLLDRGSPATWSGTGRATPPPVPASAPPGSRSMGCCGPRRPTTRSPITQHFPLRCDLVLPGGGAGRAGPDVHDHRADVPRPGRRTGTRPSTGARPAGS